MSISDNHIIICEDCLVALKAIPDNSMDSLITDPPAGISFMGKGWDKDKGGREHWIKWMQEIMVETLRVLKPGAHGLVWAIPRTSHWTATALENAGFQIRDVINHLFGSGFPKNLNINKQLDKQGLTCQCEGNAVPYQNETAKHQMRPMQEPDISSTVRSEEKQDEILQHSLSEQSLFEQRTERTEPKVSNGKQSSLEGGLLHRTGKGLYDDPQTEPPESEAERLCIGTHTSSGKNPEQTFDTDRGSSSHKQKQARQSEREPKDICDPQRALDGTPFPRCSKCEKQILQKGLGSSLKPASEHWILIRKPISEKTIAKNVLEHGTGGINIDASRVSGDMGKDRSLGKPRRNDNTIYWKSNTRINPQNPQGRFPANLILSHHSECVEVGTKEVKGYENGPGGNTFSVGKGNDGTRTNPVKGHANEDGKETVQDWNCHPDCAVNMLDDQSGISTHASATGGASRFFYTAKASKKDRGKDNNHPTVKSTKLMKYLIRMITPPNGTVLDPFMGSGSTLIACEMLGFKSYGIEQSQEYCDIALKRLEDLC